MSYETPDERHDYTGWSLLRFGTACFVDLFFPPGEEYVSGRYEITHDEFEGLKSGDLALPDLLDQFQRSPQSRMNEPVKRRTDFGYMAALSLIRKPKYSPPSSRVVVAFAPLLIISALIALAALWKEFF